MSVISSIKQLKENNFFIFIPMSNKLEPIKINLYVNIILIHRKIEYSIYRELYRNIFKLIINILVKNLNL